MKYLSYVRGESNNCENQKCRFDSKFVFLTLSSVCAARLDTIEKDLPFPRIYWRLSWQFQVDCLEIGYWWSSCPVLDDKSKRKWLAGCLDFASNPEKFSGLLLDNCESGFWKGILPPILLRPTSSIFLNTPHLRERAVYGISYHNVDDDINTMPPNGRKQIRETTGHFPSPLWNDWVHLVQSNPKLF